jgi:hypothetical protein
MRSILFDSQHLVASRRRQVFRLFVCCLSFSKTDCSYKQTFVRSFVRSRSRWIDRSADSSNLGAYYMAASRDPYGIDRTLRAAQSKYVVIVCCCVKRGVACRLTIRVDVAGVVGRRCCRTLRTSHRHIGTSSVVCCIVDCVVTFRAHTATMNRRRSCRDCRRLGRRSRSLSILHASQISVQLFFQSRLHRRSRRPVRDITTPQWRSSRSDVPHPDEEEFDVGVIVGNNKIISTELFRAQHRSNNDT